MTNTQKIHRNLNGLIAELSNLKKEFDVRYSNEKKMSKAGIGTSIVGLSFACVGTGISLATGGLALPLLIGASTALSISGTSVTTFGLLYTGQSKYQSIQHKKKFKESVFAEFAKFLKVLVVEDFMSSIAIETLNSLGKPNEIDKKIKTALDSLKTSEQFLDYSNKLLQLKDPDFSVQFESDQVMATLELLLVLNAIIIFSQNDDNKENTSLSKRIEYVIEFLEPYANKISKKLLN